MEEDPEPGPLRNPNRYRGPPRNPDHPQDRRPPLNQRAPRNQPPPDNWRLNQPRNPPRQIRPQAPGRNPDHFARAQNRPRPLNRPHQQAMDAQRGRNHRHPYRGINTEHGSHQSPANDQDNENYRYQRPSRNEHKSMGFKALEDIAMSDPIEIIEKINIRKESFFNIFTKPIEADVHVLIVQILSKLCLSSFKDLKSRLLREICNSGYLMHLTNYLMELPYVTSLMQKQRNRFYWNNQEDFWTHFILFCESMFDMAQTFAMQKCRPLIEMSSKMCLEQLKKKHAFVLSQDNITKLDDLRDRVLNLEKKNEEETQTRKSTGPTESEEAEPPEHFREMSVIPSRDELFEKEPFLRSNVVRGQYRDVEHYLDVQFRLLREDCFGPLRDGLLQYIENSKHKRYDNMRVYRNVKFIGPYISNSKSGVLIKLDEKTHKEQKNVNWAQNKRFIFGSLLLFSKDNCDNFVIATVLDRDIKYLSQGIIPVAIVQNANLLSAENILNTHDSYVMFESEVYFEPYFHVLKALQEPNFPRHIAMSKYIVDVDPTPRPPNYLHEDAIFTVETLQSPKTIFKVLNPSTWPSAEDLKFNQSQFEAYQLALTHEFAVIQGPPGTGKTYLGVKVAQTLFENLFSGDHRDCLMLIICYTNHALDQFLEHILKVTKSIVRIGGQSRNEAMQDISLNNLRQTSAKQNSQANKLYYTEKRNLKILLGKLQTAQHQIESLSNGILTFNSLCEFVPEVREYFKQGNSGEDPLFTWLMQHANYAFDNEIQALFEDTADLTDLVNFNVDDDRNERTAVMLEDTEEIIDIDINGIEVQTRFMLNEAENKILQLLKQYKHTKKWQEKQNLQAEIHELYHIKSIFLEMRNKHRARGVPRLVKENESLLRLPHGERWDIYFTWANAAINRIRELTAPLQEELNMATATYEEARMNLDLHLLRNVSVVGMTTSGAARLRKMLEVLAPPIVIVEEAAEVLEQHIVTALTRHCKHLILIGDHQQLRPSAAYMKMARHYNIEVSLFERMILNNIHSRRLRVQHRMRPEISALISPHIYPDLENHPSVEGFPKVLGITSNMFFYSHNHTEDKVDDNASRVNSKEADMVLAFANYLMQQGYDPQDVTILAAYSGQMFYLRNQRAKYVFLGKIKITVVDNYQGEESKIILLSLVRNNSKNIIGFLGTENRICVALSRAKEGFYIFGNIDILKTKSVLWTNIAKTLEDGGNIGTELTLKCENHPDEITIISSVKDFEKVPEGGCQLMCNHNLPACGHPCPRICHGYDRGHTNVQCQLKCERVICELDHVCPLKCFVKCRPCSVPVLKRLPCGHEASLACHLEPASPDVKCHADVSVELPACGHKTNKPCYLDVKYVSCVVPCAARARCGHACRRRCHAADDPDHERYVCQKPCANAKKGCTADLIGDRGDHQCSKLCHEACDKCDVEVVKKRSSCKHTERIACHKDVDEKECRKKCARMLPCGHFCKKKCFEKCGDCDQKVTKVIPACGHSVSVSCSTEPVRALCLEPCKRRLACGHACEAACGAPCDPARCAQPAARARPAPCGHAVHLPCNLDNEFIDNPPTKAELEEALARACAAACGAALRCGHACAGACARCRGARLHAPCAQRCHATSICGHVCEEPCNQVCPPCKKRCEVKCPHSECSGTCGAPCMPCQEKCERRCSHGSCPRRCGEPCSRAPCSEACPLRLGCGHACRGLCGEPCPPVCALCSPDTFPRDFLGDEFPPDAKFIQLQDCSHILEVEDADNLMNGDKESIYIRACPFCRKPIINTYRYKDLVNEMYRTEINPIKERVYGTADQVKEKKIELVETFAELTLKQDEIKNDNKHYKKAYDKLQTIVRTQNKMSLLQLEMYFVYMNILDIMGTHIKSYKEVKITKFNTAFSKQIEMISEVLVNNIKKISQQQQEDINNELMRMGAIVQLSQLFGHITSAHKDHPKILEAAKKAQSCIISWKIYEKDEGSSALKKLKEELKVTDIIAERELIVKAIGLKSGHWYKCPNGHFYCIGECGGAMEVSKCIECGAEIGGSSHRLLGDNRHAPEMDGSRYAAWSEEYNNMANFNLD